MSIIKYIKQQGFKEVNGSVTSISTMTNIRVRFLHSDGREIVYGLNEYKKPPTLIYPRPRILRTFDGVIYDQHRDDVMNYCLQKESPADIFKAMFDDSILFEYN